MNRTAHFLAVTGVALQLLIPITLWMSIADMNSAVASLDLSQHDRVDRVMTSVGNVTGKMGTAVEPILWGGGLAIIGLVVFAIAITRFRYRRPWAFWFSCIYGGCMALVFPTGTPFGLFLLIFALTRRTEFGHPPSPQGHLQPDTEQARSL